MESKSDIKRPILTLDKALETIEYMDKQIKVLQKSHKGLLFSNVQKTRRIEHLTNWVERLKHERK